MTTHLNDRKATPVPKHPTTYCIWDDYDDDCYYDDHWESMYYEHEDTVVLSIKDNKVTFVLTDSETFIEEASEEDLQYFPHFVRKEAQKIVQELYPELYI